MEGMKVKVFGVVLVICYCFAVVVALKQPKCRGKEVKLTEEDMKGMTDCIKEVVPDAGNETDPTKVNSKVSKEKMACLGKCILGKEGLIDDKGMPSKENMMMKINSTMPEDVMQELDEAIGKCVDELGGKADPNDTTCQSYEPLTQCMHMALIEVCKEKKM